MHFSFMYHFLQPSNKPRTLVTSLCQEVYFSFKLFSRSCFDFQGLFLPLETKLRLTISQSCEETKTNMLKEYFGVLKPGPYVCKFGCVNDSYSLIRFTVLELVPYKVPADGHNAVGYIQWHSQTDIIIVFVYSVYMRRSLTLISHGMWFGNPAIRQTLAYDDSHLISFKARLQRGLYCVNYSQPVCDLKKFT